MLATNCTHPEESHYTKVLSAVVCAETTITICGDCGEPLSKPVTNT
jgi:hypothetical protein